MKTALVRLLIVLLLFVSTKFATAGDFVSVVMQGTSTLLSISVPPDRFLVISNFTQDALTMPRGSVSVMTNNSTAPSVFTASVTDPNAATLEPVNSFHIGGPATVNVTCPAGTTCFITYRKGDE